MSLISELVGSVLELPGMFLDVAAQGPIQAILLGFGALFVGVAALVFGVLALWAAVKFLIPERVSTPGQRAG